METIQQVHDTPLKEDATNTLELIKKIRADHQLLPIMRAKRPLPVTIDDEKLESQFDACSEKKSRLIHIKETIDKENVLQEEKRVELMNRLKSFSVLYHSTDRPLSALACAKHGWKDTHTMIEEDPTMCVLVCEECGNKMYVIEIEPKDKHRVEAIEIDRKYKSGLLDCHKDTCSWKLHQCQDKLYNFPLVNLSEGVERFKLEAKSILLSCNKMQESIPKLIHPLDDNLLSKIKYVAKHFEQEEEKKRNDRESAFILALFGWKSLHMEVPGIQCDLCFSKKAFCQVNPSESLDIVHFHKEYCPWINAATANAYPPNTLYNNQTISGSDWMIRVISMEYIMLVKKQDLALSSSQERAEKLFQLQRKIHGSNHLLRTWQESITKSSKSNEL